MKRKIHLYGALKREFGPVHSFNVETAGEAFRALNCAFPGRFLNALKAGSYEVIRGRRHGGMPLDLELLSMMRLGSADLHIVPVVQGASAKGRGATKAIIGTAIIGAAIFMSGGTLAAPLAQMGTLVPGLGAVTWGNIATMGLAVALMGAAQMTAPTKGIETADTANDQSHAINGPLNVNEQGNAIPLIYGQVITGMQPVSVSVDIENVGAYQQ